MNYMNYYLYAYGVVNILMGCLGYVNKGSIQSLIAGGVSGLLIILGTLLAQKNPTLGYGLTGFIAVALIGRFLPAYLKDMSKVYPSLVIVLLSVVAFGLLTLNHFKCCSKCSPEKDLSSH